MALVVVTHLNPDRESHLHDVISRYTLMQVVVATDQIRVADRVSLPNAFPHLIRQKKSLVADTPDRLFPFVPIRVSKSIYLSSGLRAPAHNLQFSIVFCVRHPM
jgi:hypothetical protein